MVAPAFKEVSNVIALLPGPDPSDSEGVIVALQPARALQKKGDLPESLRWLRRAAEVAEQTGNDRRALVLARAAADLTNLIHVGEAAPASSLPPPPPSNAQRAARTSGLPPPSSLPPPLHKTPPPPSAIASRPPPLPASKPVPSVRPDAGRQTPNDVAKLLSPASAARVS